MVMLIEAMGVEVDRNSFQEKVRKFMVEPKSVLEMAKDVFNTAKAAHDMIEDIVKLF
jgi:hypothetical protein